MLERLKLLENNIEEMGSFRRSYSLDDVRRDRTKEWALRYGFIESIQLMIDISCHIVGKFNLGSPSTYAECVEFLEKFGYIDGDLSERLVGMTGLRNILIHEYIDIDLERLYGLLDHISDFREFAMKTKDIL